MSLVSKSRDDVFTRAALKKHLITRKHAQEALAIARKMRDRGKGLPIEQIYVRKGYLTKAEASSLAKRLRPKGQAAAQAPKLSLAAPQAPARPARGGGLALVEEAPECPSCGKDPGDGEDCFRCGAMLDSGEPGPRATLCGACGMVVLRGTALCPRCAAPIARRVQKRAETRGSSVILDRLILLAVLGGIAYFVVYLNFFAPGEESVEEPTEAPSPLARAEQALGGGDRASAARIIEEALADDPEDARLLRRAYAAVAPPDQARAAAEAALADGRDAQLSLELARMALEEGQPEQAKRRLAQIPRSERTDAHHRLLARAEQASGGDWLAALEALQEPTPAEREAQAAALVARGRGHARAKRAKQAERDLKRACHLAPELAGAHYALGVLYLQLKRPDPARKALEKAVKLDPGPAAHYLALGLAYEAQRRWGDARRVFGSYLEIAVGVGESPGRIALVRAKLRDMPQR